MFKLLGCMPSIGDTEGIITALILYVFIKPLTYFAYIQAFRYRVSRPIPMTFRQAATLAAVRTGLGFGCVGGGTLLMVLIPGLVVVSWVYLYGARIWAWWRVGSVNAGLVGRRLLGWTIMGTLINVAFDVAFVSGALSGPVAPVAVIGGVLVVIAVLTIVGRRSTLRNRFSDSPVCLKCQYNLTGNLSGRCPECGTIIHSPEIGDSYQLPN